jgi:all-trans-retinol 13,14-reductase
MAKKSSTGALTQEQKEAQDARYAEGHDYDYVFIGTGHAALVSASLLAKAGNSVCMLEYHDVPGGYAHTFRAGDYQFCAQIHYTWNCGEGANMWHFLKKLGLEKEVTWNLYDPDGYDHMVMPDGTRVRIPYGWDKLAENIDAAYPGQKSHVKKFTNILSKIRKEMREFPSGKDVKWWEVLLKAYKFLTLLKYRNKTLQDVFDECGLSKEAQAVLIANAGDMGEPPKRLSIFPYAGLFGGYNTGAYYPTQHFKGYIDALVKNIESQDSSHIYYETEVTNVVVGNAKKIERVETKDGKIFTAKKGFICNMDPQQAAKKLIGWEKFPKKFQKQLDYDYSFSGLMLYLGLDDGIDLRDHGFGKFNIWHMEDWDMNEMWDKGAGLDFDKIWWFMSTPSLHSEDKTTTPAGGQILEIATFVSYDTFKKTQDASYAEYMKMKLEMADLLLDKIEEKHIPNLRNHIKVKQIGSPTTNEDFVLAPGGNAYGSAMTPKNLGLGRLKAWTPWDNFFWCNASSGFAGIAGTLHTGVQLYMDLTGDVFFTKDDLKTDEELIADLPKG